MFRKCVKISFLHFLQLHHFSCRTSNAIPATVPGSIPASAGSVDSEEAELDKFRLIGQRLKTCFAADTSWAVHQYGRQALRPHQRQEESRQVDGNGNNITYPLG